MLPPLKDIITRHGLSAKKSLGQHFLLDEHITDKVARLGGDITKLNIIEIGPGPGGLTRSLLKAGAQAVYAVEKDSRCIAALTELQEAFSDRLHILEADALAVKLTERVPTPRAIIANLPYNVGTALLLQWLEEIAHDAQRYAFLTLMFQKEVADRIAAAPGSKEYGRLSVLSQWLCRVEHGFDLPPGAFSPPPKVYSSVIKLTPRAEPLFAANRSALETATAAGFGQRRKMLRQSLKSVLGAQAEAILTRIGIDPTARAEQLSVEQWCAVARAITP